MLSLTALLLAIRILFSCIRIGNKDLFLLIVILVSNLHFIAVIIKTILISERFFKLIIIYILLHIILIDITQVVNIIKLTYVFDLRNIRLIIISITVHLSLEI